MTGELGARPHDISAALERYHTREKCRAFRLRRFDGARVRRSRDGVSLRNDTLLFSRSAQRDPTGDAAHPPAPPFAIFIEARTQAECASLRRRDDDSVRAHAPRSPGSLRSDATRIASPSARRCCAAETWPGDAAATGCARRPKQVTRASSFAHAPAGRRVAQIVAR